MNEGDDVAVCVEADDPVLGDEWRERVGVEEFGRAGGGLLDGLDTRVLLGGQAHDGQDLRTVLTDVEAGEAVFDGARTHERAEGEGRKKQEKDEADADDSQRLMPV